jgi:glycosyltransferase involved in cell wall biosynthesis
VACSRKVLIVAYHYPPEPASGAQRMGYLAKYLPEFGWEPTVLTRRAPHRGAAEANVVRVGAAYRATIRARRALPGRPHPAVSSVKARAREILFFPDRAAPWIPLAVTAGLAAHRRERFDAILSSAMPASAHVAAFCLKSLLRVPWLADYRDLWTGNPYVTLPPWRTLLEAWIERSMLGKADRITTITSSLAATLESLHRRPALAISNAIDSDEWKDIPFERPDRFRIVHAGTLYDGRRNPQRLLAQVSALRREGVIRDVALDFYGQDPGNLLELSRRYGLEDTVCYHGLVERREAMRAERGAALLAIIQNDDPRTASEYGSKIFEYQAAGPRILVTGPPASVLRGYVEQHALGWFAGSDDELRAALRNAYETYREGNYLRDISVAPNARVLAEAFAASLDEIVTGSQVPERRSTPVTGLDKSESAILR